MVYHTSPPAAGHLKNNRFLSDEPTFNFFAEYYINAIMMTEVSQQPLRRSERIMKKQPKETKYIPYHRRSTRIQKSESALVPVTTLEKFKIRRTDVVKQIKTAQKPKLLQIKRSDSCTSLVFESEEEIPRFVEVGPHTFQITTVNDLNGADQVGPYAEASQNSLTLDAGLTTTQNSPVFPQILSGFPFFLAAQFPLLISSHITLPNSSPISSQISPPTNSPISPPINSPISPSMPSLIFPPNPHQIPSTIPFPEYNPKQNPYGLPPRSNFTSPPIHSPINAPISPPITLPISSSIHSPNFPPNHHQIPSTTPFPEYNPEHNPHGLPPRTNLTFPPIHSPISPPITSPISPSIHSPNFPSNPHQIPSTTPFSEYNPEHNPHGLPPRTNFTSPLYNCQLQVEMLNPLFIKNSQLVRSGIFKLLFGSSQIQMASEITFGNVVDNYIFESTFSPYCSNFPYTAFNTYPNNQQTQFQQHSSQTTTKQRYPNLSEPNQIFMSGQGINASDEATDLTHKRGSRSLNPESRFSGHQNNPPRPHTPYPTRVSSPEHRDTPFSVNGQFYPANSSNFHAQNLPRSHTTRPTGGISAENKNPNFSMGGLPYPTNCDGLNFQGLEPRDLERNLPRSHTPHSGASVGNRDNSFAKGGLFSSAHNEGSSSTVPGASFSAPYQHLSGAPTHLSEDATASYDNDIPCTSSGFNQSNNRDPRLYSSRPNYSTVFQNCQTPTPPCANDDDDVDLPSNLEESSSHVNNITNDDTAQLEQPNFIRPVDVSNLQEKPNLIENRMKKMFEPQSQIVYEKHYDPNSSNIIIKYGDHILENIDVDEFIDERKHILGIKKPLIIEEIEDMDQFEDIDEID